MIKNILLGRGREFKNIPEDKWREELADLPPHVYSRLDFMTEDHHLVRNFVVRELPAAGMPLSPEFISQTLDISPGRLLSILDDLEKHLFFLVRNEQGAVTWAFPVTVDNTPHKLMFSTGERLNGA